MVGLALARPVKWRASLPRHVNARESAERVAHEALAALGRRTVHVVGGLNRLGAALIRFAPRRAVVPIAERVMGRLLPR